MVSFWCGNTLLEGDFKNTKTYQNTRAIGGPTTPFLPRKI